MSNEVSEVTDKCPICGKHDLQYCQNADINFKLVNGRLRAMLNIHDLSFMDDTSLYCINCGADNVMYDELHELHQKYDQLMIDKETA